MGLLGKRNLTQVPAIPLATTYHSHATLTLEKFIECYVDGNLSVLVSRGTPTDGELKDYWNEYLAVYYELIGSVESRNFFLLQKQIEVKQMQLEILERSIEVYINFRHNKDLEDAIKEIKQTIGRLGFHFEASFDNDKILKLYETHVRAQGMELQRMYLTLEQQMAGKGGDGKPNRERFIESMIVMAKNGFHVTLKDSVEYYCKTVKMYNMFCEQQEKIFNKGKK